LRGIGTGISSGISSGTDFFLRLKKEDFFVIVGWVVFTWGALELAASFRTCFGRRETGAAEVEDSGLSGGSASKELGVSCCKGFEGSGTTLEEVLFLLEPNMRRKNPALSLSVGVFLNSP
jgi:hypothetical protein